MKLRDRELGVVKALRMAGKSWDHVQEELTKMGFKVQRSSLIVQCRHRGVLPKEGGGVSHESWCAPKSSMTREARRLRAYRARKRYGLVVSKNDIVEKPSSLPSADVVSLRAKEELGVGIIEPVIVPSLPVRLALPADPEASVVSVAQIRGSDLGSVTGLVESEEKDKVPTLTPVVSSQTLVRDGVTKKVAEATGENVASEEIKAPVVPISGPEKVARAIPGIPAASDNTSGVPEVHASGRFMVIGEDGKERSETVMERRARMKKVQEDAEARVTQEEKDKAEQAERDKADQAARELVYKKARQEKYGSLWGTRETLSEQLGPDSEAGEQAPV